MDAEPQSPAVRLAVETLARELGCPGEQIVVQDVTSVTWRTSALGCPRPDMMYLQVLTPGYRVRLIHGDREYVLHTDRGQRAIRCDGSVEEPLQSEA